jgi:hypothetical protein
MWVLILELIINGVARGIVLDLRIEPVQSSPGLYYQHEAEARLYNSEWKIVTYLNLKQASDNVYFVSRYIEQTIEFCRKHDDTFG